MRFFITLMIFGFVINFLGAVFSQEEGSSPSQEEMGPGSPKGEAGGVKEEESKKEIIQSLPVLEIKRLEGEKPLYSIELRDVELADLFRVLAHDYDMNFVIDKNVKGKVTASLTNVSLEEALDVIAKMNNLRLEKKDNVIIVKPDLITKVFILKHVEASSLLKTGSSESESGLTGESATGTETTGGTETATQGSTETQTGGESTSEKSLATIYDLLSEDGKVLLGKQPNSIMVIDYPENVAKVEAYLKMVDKGMMMKVFKLKYISAKDLIGEGGEGGEESTGTESTGTESTGEGSAEQ